MSYTKGPWVKDKWGTVYGTDGKPVLFDGLFLAGLSTNETKSNRDLVAAAPELLEALQDCYRALIAQGCHLDRQMPLTERLDVAKKAQDVIAKALGK